MPPSAEILLHTKQTKYLRIHINSKLTPGKTCWLCNDRIAWAASSVFAYFTKQQSGHTHSYILITTFSFPLFIQYKYINSTLPCSIKFFSCLKRTTSMMFPCLPVSLLLWLRLLKESFYPGGKNKESFYRQLLNLRVFIQVFAGFFWGLFWHSVEVKRVVMMIWLQG